VSRRTTRRFFLLRPDAGGEQQRLFLYLLGVAAAKHGIRVYCVICMSTHYHLVCSDVEGQTPRFFRDLHRWLAMTLKCHRGWDEEVWNKSQTSRVDLESETALVDKCGYTIANCVAAGIVDRPRRYPGVITLAAEMGVRRDVIARPDNPWLVSETTWPAEVELRFEMPPELLAEYGDLAGAQAAIQGSVDRHVRDARALLRAAGKGYVGAKRCMRASIETRSTKAEPLRSRNPTFAVGAGKPRSAFFAAVEKMRGFREAYAARWARYADGDRGSPWPAGTWKMRVLHGSTVESCGPP